MPRAPLNIDRLSHRLRQGGCPKRLFALSGIQTKTIRSTQSPMLPPTEPTYWGLLS